MANEITITATLRIIKNSTTSQFSKTLTQDLDSDEQHSIVQEIANSNEAVDTGDIAVVDLDWVLLANLDDSLTVAIYQDNADANLIATIGPGEFYLSPKPEQLYVKASAAGPMNLAVIAAGD